MGHMNARVAKVQDLEWKAGQLVDKAEKLA